GSAVARANVRLCCQDEAAADQDGGISQVSEGIAAFIGRDAQASGFDRQQRHALYAELAASALRVIRDELVLRIVLDLDEAQSCVRDHPAVIVLLRRAADASRP